MIELANAPRSRKMWDNTCIHFTEFTNDQEQVQTAFGADFHEKYVE